MLLRQKRMKLNTHLKAFTLVELLVGIAILSIVIALALPNLNDFLVRSKVDSEISELHRLVLTARNNAINTGTYVTICPLKDNNECENNWQNELSVFTNSVNTTTNASTFTSNAENLIKVKSAVNDGYTLKSNQALIIFAPTGRLVGNSAITFSFCPSKDTDLSRGVEISITGRVSSTTNLDSDEVEEFRSGTEVSC